MSTVKKLKDAVVSAGTPDEIMSNFDFAGKQDNESYSLILFVQQADKLLNESQRYAVMEKLGCCKTGQRDKECKAFAKLHKDKSLKEKLALFFKDVKHMADNSLNEDGTISVKMGCIGLEKIVWCS